MTQTREFVQMINHPNYEISVDFPHTIRRIDNQREVSEWENNYGYIHINLFDSDKCRNCKKHRLIAEQFLPNPDGLIQVDHINHNRKDNRIENLRWVSASTNQFNRSSNNGVQYEFIDDIPENAIVVDFYDTRNERREFDDDKYYYYRNEESDEDIFYSRIDENVYKILHINICRNGARVVKLRDTNNKAVSVYINKFKQQHDLI